jgi:hypothetical protein
VRKNLGSFRRSFFTVLVSYRHGFVCVGARTGGKRTSDQNFRFQIFLPSSLLHFSSLGRSLCASRKPVCTRWAIGRWGSRDIVIELTDPPGAAVNPSYYDQSLYFPEEVPSLAPPSSGRDQLGRGTLRGWLRSGAAI